jgi:hypothetical protein
MILAGAGLVAWAMTRPPRLAFAAEAAAD